MSTQTMPAPAEGHTPFDANGQWRLAPSVALRPEPFGALAYDFTTRKLSFLKSPQLVRVVERLERSVSATAAVHAVITSVDERPGYLAALSTLAATGMITPCSAGKAF